MTVNRSGKTFIFFLFSAMLTINSLVAQTHDHRHEHHNHKHIHPSNEIGIGTFVSYLAGEQKIAPGIHFHFLRTINETRFGYGAGYEQIFDEHTHRVASFIGSYMPIPHVLVAIAPGILFPNQENPQSSFVVHSEVVYEFEIGPFHIGPTVEFATTFDEFHIGGGLHFGYAF